MKKLFFLSAIAAAFVLLASCSAFESPDERRKVYWELKHGMENELGRQKFGMLSGKFAQECSIRELKLICAALEDDGNITRGELPQGLINRMKANGQTYLLIYGRF